MASTVYQTNKKTGVVYAYHSESYRDPITKQPKVRRTYLGRVDPETHLIIPKAEEGKRNTSKIGNKMEEAVQTIMPVEATKILNEKTEQIKLLQDEIATLKSESADEIAKLQKQRKAELDALQKQIRVMSEALNHLQAMIAE